jgi:hypothetical protein
MKTESSRIREVRNINDAIDGHEDRASTKALQEARRAEENRPSGCFEKKQPRLHTGRIPTQVPPVSNIVLTDYTV